MKQTMESRVEGLIKMLQGVTDKSVAVGFGVSRPEQVGVRRVGSWGSMPGAALHAPCLRFSCITLRLARILGHSAACALGACCTRHEVHAMHRDW